MSPDLPAKVDAPEQSPKPSAHPYILSYAAIRKLLDARLAKKIVAFEKSTVKCIVCDLGSVATLVRVDRVPTCSAFQTRGAEKREYVHGACVPRLRKKYPALVPGKRTDIKTVPQGHVYAGG